MHCLGGFVSGSRGNQYCGLAVVYQEQVGSGQLHSGGSYTMPKGYPGFILAVFGWLLLAAGLNDSRDIGRKPSESEKTIAQSLNTVARAQVEAVKPKKPSIYESHCHKGEDRRQSDLCAQWYAADAAKKSADWTMWSTIFGAVGTAAVVYTLMLTRASAKAAMGTLNAQIESSRPLLNLSSVSIVRSSEQPDDGQLQLNCGWEIKNYGSTGCWIESICVTFDDIIDDDIKLDERPISAFIAPGNVVSRRSDKGPVRFYADESQRVIDHKAIILLGYTTYRDAGGRRWKTGFAVSIDLDDSFSGNTFGPILSDDHWIDERLPARRAKENWLGKWGIGRFA